VRIAALVSLAFIASAMPSRAGETASTVRFSNNDHLTGSMVSLTPARLVWKSEILEKPTDFLLGKVLEITLPASQPESNARHEASVTLTNGDLIRGQLTSVSDDTVELDTWFAGRMRFNRLMISDIRIAERPDLIYRGPSGLDGWKQSGSKPAWTFQSAALRSDGTGSIARELPDLPDECSLAFDLAWRDRLTMRIAILSDNLTSDRPSAGYELQIQSRNVTLRSSKGQRFIGQTTNVPMLQENEKARIELRASARNGKVSLYIDGEVIENWTDPQLNRSAFGKGIHFISQNISPVQVSRIEVGAWDGETEPVPDARFQFANRGFGDDLEDQPSSEAVAPDANSGRMELRNGDSIAGEVQDIVDGMIRVKTPFREVKLPVEALRSLALRPVDLERTIRKNGDVRAWFPDGSSLVFRLDQVGDGTVTGFSQNFGNATFKLAAFSRIEFNIYELDLEDIRIANGW
jgi:hypothetical protein